MLRKKHRLGSGKAEFLEHRWDHLCAEAQWISRDHDKRELPCQRTPGEPIVEPGMRNGRRVLSVSGSILCRGSRGNVRVQDTRSLDSVGRSLRSPTHSARDDRGNVRNMEHSARFATTTRSICTLFRGGLTFARWRPAILDATKIEFRESCGSNAA